MMTRRPARAAFTLIELLVVIAIIGILMSLILPAVQKIRGTGPRLVAKNDIEQMSSACTAFKNKFGFYPPCAFAIPTKTTDPGFAILKQMFPRWSGTPDASFNIQPPLPGAGTNITGSQCLVYFLGGPGGTGWAVDAPVAPSANAAAKNTFMDFPIARLVNGAFIDPWKTQPYMYLSSGPGGKYGASAFYPPNIAPVSVYSYGGGKPVNPNGVQIISAGENKAFGPGGAWTPGTGVYSAQGAGFDDIANFNGGLTLGVPNN